MTGRWHTQCFIIDASRGEWRPWFPSLLWDPRVDRLSLLRASRKERDAHPTLAWGENREREGGRGKEGKLRLTVNFVVPRVVGVVRNFEALGLTFRSAGNPTAVIQPKYIAGTRRRRRDL